MDVPQNVDAKFEQFETIKESKDDSGKPFSKDDKIKVRPAAAPAMPEFNYIKKNAHMSNEKNLNKINPEVEKLADEI